MGYVYISSLSYFVTLNLSTDVTAGATTGATTGATMSVTTGVTTGATMSATTGATMGATGTIPHPIDPATGKIIHDAIKIEYHPNSGCGDEVKSFYDFRHQHMNRPQVVDEEPWAAFGTRADYEYAEIALAASLSARQNTALISLIHRIASGVAKFTIKSSKDLQDRWEMS